MALILFSLVVAGLVVWMLCSGINHESRHPSLPRERRMGVIQQMGQQLGWWPTKDFFGLRPDPTFLPPAVEVEQHTKTIAEVTGETATREIKKVGRVEEILGA